VAKRASIFANPEQFEIVRELIAFVYSWHNEGELALSRRLTEHPGEEEMTDGLSLSSFILI
jgi:hypothetical protein